jgi:hypothetical protein
MSVDDLLFTIIIGGAALSIAYLRAQYMTQRSYRIAERGSELRLRELYANRPNSRSPLNPLNGRPASRTSASQVSPNAILNGTLPVHVRFVYRAEPSSAAADEGHFRCHEGQKLYI